MRFHITSGKATLPYTSCIYIHRNPRSNLIIGLNKKYAKTFDENSYIFEYFFIILHNLDIDLEF